MASTLDEKFAFEAEWYDPHACLIRKYQVLYYVTDSTVEIYDVKNRRQFLKRSKTEISLLDLYIGSTIAIHARQFKIVAYGDEYSRKALSSKKERTLGIIKPDVCDKFSQILEAIYDRGFKVTKMKMCQLSRSEAGQFYQEHQAKSFYNGLIQFMSSGPVIAFELIGEGAILNWRALIGPTDSATARSEAPASLRARFGTDNTRNACHGSDSEQSATREIEFFFPSKGVKRRSTATFTDCTLCVIKPHTVLAGNAGKIISEIKKAGFEVSALQMFNMERANAEEFYEIYKGVLQEYKDFHSRNVI
ncbi:NME7 [Bugula neritina]|uniref:Nucleoside diphosphate kinase n=1 Tax=Bugula neritina TaxID=10212 RepID=A0A7J7J8V1_BUGNE|nr:NME7 [Bugula neritina]